MQPSSVRLQLEGVSKAFPGVRALDGVSLDVRVGEIHALCGENGAGKSTLMHMLVGNHQPDAGRIVWEGQVVTIENGQQANALGIAIVYQERSLVADLSVAENIFADNQPTNRWGLIDFNRLHTQTKALLDKLGLHELDSRTPVGTLSVAKQQMVEIAKALAKNPRLLILDEPTASITEKEIITLFRIVQALQKEGVSIVYISHRMAEIFAIADRVSVLKDGRYQGTRTVNETTVDELIRLMVGRDLVLQERVSYRTENVMLETRHLSGFGFQDISFQLHEGEILALAGLVGAGRTEVARAIFGADSSYVGEVWLKGQLCAIDHPADAIRLGIGYLPEDRKEKGLFLEMSMADNVVAANLASVANGNFIRAQEVEAIAQTFRSQLRIATPTTAQTVMHLSGGNQQKVLLARWLLRKPNVFIVDEPTHGVDVGAKAEIYTILRELARTGVAILLISSELPEVLALSDRILVMWNGQLTAGLPRELATEQEIMHYASGVKNMFGRFSRKM